MAIYNPKSHHAEEFINHEEIIETIRYAEENKHNVELIDRILEKVALGEYPRVIHRDAVMERVFSEMYQVPQTIRLPYPASAKNCLYDSSVNSRLKSAPARPMAFDRPLVEPLSVRFM